MDMNRTRDNSAVDLLRKCAAQDHGMARLRDALGVGLESGWQLRCLAEVADMMEAELDDIDTLARVRGEKMMEQDAMLASLLECLKGDYRISAEWDGLRMVWTTETDGDWCTAGDKRIEELEAELEAEREEAAFFEAERDRLYKVLADMERTHVKLPFDVDGVPIRPGDEMTQGEGTFIATVHYWPHCTSVTDGSGFAYATIDISHVKPDTVKSLLEEFENHVRCDGADDASIADYAERIRKAVKNGD